MSQNDPHDPKDTALLRAMGADAEVTSLKRKLFDKSADYRYSYNWKWMGRPIIQYPEDMIALAEIVWTVQPDLVVETGIAHGGSLVYFASLLKLLGGKRLALGIDIDIRAHNKAAIDAHPMADSIEMIQGSSIEQSTIDRVTARAREFGNPLVILDSNHTEAHVLAELRAYSGLVRKGSYLVVLDTGIEYVSSEYAGRAWGKGDNPLTAVRKFLAENARFEIDAEYDDKLLLTVAPSGFLRCIADP